MAGPGRNLARMIMSTLPVKKSLEDRTSRSFTR